MEENDSYHIKAYFIKKVLFVQHHIKYNIKADVLISTGNKQQDIKSNITSAVHKRWLPFAVVFTRWWNETILKPGTAGKSTFIFLSDYFCGMAKMFPAETQLNPPRLRSSQRYSSFLFLWKFAASFLVNCADYGSVTTSALQLQMTEIHKALY